MLFLLSLITLPISCHDHQVEVEITEGVNLMCMKLMESARIGELPKGKVGPLAQLVEQRTFNPWVDGSSPSGPTRYSVASIGNFSMSKSLRIPNINL